MVPAAMTNPVHLDFDQPESHVTTVIPTRTAA